MKNFLFSCTISLAVLVGLFAVSIGVLNFILRKEFVVHTKGVVLITGTSTGIGRNASFELAERGYVVFCGVRKEKDVQSLNDEAKLRKLENFIVPIILDVSVSKHITSALETVTDYLKKKDLPLVGIVNNAGISFRLPVEVAPLGEVKSFFNVNFFSTIEVTQTFLPLIRKDKGRIVFISSVSSAAPLVGTAFYSSSKRALEALVDSLRLEMEPFGVSVTSILPGYIKTEIEDKVRDYKDYNLSDKEYQLYKNYFDTFRAKRKKAFETAGTPRITSDAIIHSLTDPYPQTRYAIGPTGTPFSAYMVILLGGILPDRLFDFLKNKNN